MTSETYTFKTCIGDIDIQRREAPTIAEFVKEQRRAVLGDTYNRPFLLLPVERDTGRPCVCGNQSTHIIDSTSPEFRCSNCLDLAAEQMENQLDDDMGDLLAQELDTTMTEHNDELQRIDDRIYVETDAISRPHQTPSGDYLLPSEINGFELHDPVIRDGDIEFRLENHNMHISFNTGYESRISIKGEVDAGVDFGRGTATYNTYSSMTWALKAVEDATERIDVDVSFE